jgi:hypothetical protein
VTQIAEEFGISDVALAKICRRLNVPTPPRGYWARLAAGRASKRPPLPQVPTSSATAHTIRRWKAPNDIPIPSAEDIDAAPVEPTLDGAHPLVLRTRAALNRHPHSPDSGQQPAEQALDVAVTAEAADRALRVMDSILRTIEARGHELRIRELKTESSADAAKVSWITEAIIAGTPVVFGVDEGFDTIEIAPPPPPRAREAPSWALPRPVKERLPNGRLILTIRNAPYGARTTWADGKRQAVEGLVGVFVLALEHTAAAINAARLETQRAAEQARERERRWIQEHERRRRREELVRDLGDRLQRLSQVRSIHRLLALVENDGSVSGPSSQPIARRWAAWLRAYADELQRELVADIPDPAPPM